MRLNWARVFLIAVLCLAVTGCPGTSTIQIGTWLFTIKIGSGDSFALAFELLANGQLQAPNPVPDIADGAAENGGSWAQNGSTFTMTETKIGEDWLYTGSVHSSTSMSGTWAMDNNPSQVSGVWAATWLPQ